MLTVDISLEEKDYSFFIYYTQFGAPEKKRKLITMNLISIFSWMIFFVVIVYDLLVDNNKLDAFFAIGMGVVLFWSLGIFGRKKSTEKLVNGLYTNLENESIFEKKEYLFSETGILVTGKTISTQINWSAVIREIKIKEYVFLYLSSIEALIIPLESFNDSQIEALNNLLAQHLSFRAAVGHVIAK